ncbi:hypothetical protein ARSEF4850_009829, partial [Beauveria asiatica]
MRRHRELRILQYNVQKSKDIVLASLFSDSRVLEYDILAIQEPWRNPYIDTTYHPLKKHFRLTYLADSGTRVCFYIHRRLDPSTWAVSHISRDIVTFTIHNPLTGTSVCIFNVYNEVTTDTLRTLANTLRAVDQHHEIIVMGDFNLRHPLWSTTHRSAETGPNAQDLLIIIEDFELQLLTEPGMPTHRWNGGISTIDLTFATHQLASRVIRCKIDRRLDCDSDHLPIGLTINWNWQPAATERKRLWSRTDAKILRQTVLDHLPLHVSLELEDEESIDAHVTQIISALEAGIEASTPWSNPSPHSIAGFNQECKDICTEVQQLRRKWQRTRQDNDYEAYRQARNRKGRHIQKALRNNFRQRVEESSSSQSGLWKL